MIVSAFMADFVAVGFFFYSYSVFFIPLSEEFGGSRLDTSLGITLMSVIGALLSPFIGILLDRTTVRRVMLPGTILAGASFILLAMTQSRLQFYLVLALAMTTGITAMGGITCAKLIANWYRKRLGLALGIAAVGISASGVAMPPIATWLIEQFGWRIGLACYGGFVFFVLLPALSWLVISHPKDIGQQTDDARSVDNSGQPSVSMRTFPWSQRKLLRTRTLWILVLCFGFIYSAVQTLFTHIVPMARDIGIGPYKASILVSCCAAAAVAGKLGFGLLLGRISGRNAMFSLFILQIIGLTIIFYSPSFLWLLLACCIFGFGFGGGVPLQNTLTSNIFGVDSLGKSLGLTRLLSAPLMSSGAPLAGWLYDAYGSYEYIWLYHIVALCGSLILIYTLPTQSRIMR